MTNRKPLAYCADLAWRYGNGSGEMIDLARTRWVKGGARKGRRRRRRKERRKGEMGEGEEGEEEGKIRGGEKGKEEEGEEEGGKWRGRGEEDGWAWISGTMLHQWPPPHKASCIMHSTMLHSILLPRAASASAYTLHSTHTHTHHTTSSTHLHRPPPPTTPTITPISTLILTSLYHTAVPYYL
jgi:hypothetical protein